MHDRGSDPPFPLAHLPLWNLPAINLMEETMCYGTGCPFELPSGECNGKKPKGILCPPFDNGYSWQDWLDAKAFARCCQAESVLEARRIIHWTESDKAAC